MTAETLLMWAAAVTLAAAALAAAAAALWFAAATLRGCLIRYRVRGLTREQIGACVRLAAHYRRQNGTRSGPVSPPEDPVQHPRRRYAQETNR